MGMRHHPEEDVCKAPAIGNRDYTDKTHLRGFKTLDFVLVHFCGLCLYSRDFQSPNTFKTQLLKEKLR